MITANITRIFTKWCVHGCEKFVPAFIELFNLALRNFVMETILCTPLIVSCPVLSPTAHHCAKMLASYAPPP